MSRLTTSFRRADLVLFGATILLVAIGLAALYSVTLNVEQPRIEKFYRQGVSFLIGLTALLVLMSLDFRFLRTYGWLLYAGGVLVLMAVFLVGTTFRGTTGWFSFFGATFQPVELMKVVLVVALARFFADHIDEVMRWRTIVISGLLTALPTGMVLLQPDLGSAFILVAIWVGFLVFLGLPFRKLGVIVLGFIVVAGMSWFALQPYQRDRILTFIDPARDPLRSGYNVRQSIVAVGSGMLFGRGLGLGTQSQLNFLPTQDTDFIFAVIAEELGFIGVSVLLFLFVTLIFRIVRPLESIRDAFGSLLLAGFGVMFAVEILLNISGNIGLLPITGTPLPFLSYGGSALIMSMLAVGICLSVKQRA